MPRPEKPVPMISARVFTGGLWAVVSAASSAIVIAVRSFLGTPVLDTCHQSVGLARAGQQRHGATQPTGWLRGTAAWIGSSGSIFIPSSAVVPLLAPSMIVVR